ncbi:MAG: hypothetical protein ACYDH1_12235 [Anaerolineaceae bacterium]
MISENDEIQDQLPVLVKHGIFQGESKDEVRLKMRIDMSGFELEIIPIEKVNGKHHKQGAVRKQFQVVLENFAATDATLNLSPFVVDGYRR